MYVREHALGHEVGTCKNIQDTKQIQSSIIEKMYNGLSNLTIVYPHMVMYIKEMIMLY